MEGSFSRSESPRSVSAGESPASRKGPEHYPSASATRTTSNGSQPHPCHWNECEATYPDCASLVDHLSQDHIGYHKSSYSCSWRECSRQGDVQARQALISHMRSHTGEKPFLCDQPACDRAFTRLDALSKHLRQQHNVTLTPLSGSHTGGRKRKRDADSLTSVATPGDKDKAPGLLADLPAVPPGYSANEQAGQARTASPNLGDPDSALSDNDTSTQLHHSTEPSAVVTFRRPAWMVQYLIAKAKYRYALQERDVLLDELTALRREEERERDEKERLLDDVLKGTHSD